MNLSTNMTKINGVLGSIVVTLVLGASVALAQPAPSMQTQPPEILATAAPAAMPEAQKLRGTMQSVDEAKQRITLEDGTVLTISPAAKVAPSSLKNGAKISALYEERKGEKVLTAVRIEPPPTS